MKNSQMKEQQRLQQVRDAAVKYLPATSTLTVDGHKVTVPDVLKVLDASLAAFVAEQAAKATLTTAKADRRQQQLLGAQEITALKVAVTAELGSTSPLLVPFGFAKKPRVPLTAQQKVLRAAKAKLTRQARGTKGSKQKLAVTSQGSAGLVLVQPDGTPLVGVLNGPTAPVAPSPKPVSAPQGSASAQASNPPPVK